MSLALAVATLAFTASQGDYRARFPLPGPVVGDGWGVNIHFTKEKQGELKMIRDAGFKWVRMDMLWSQVEKAKGHYDFSNYDVLLRDLESHGLRAILILDYGNNQYQPTSPTSSDARAAFARFAAAAVTRFQGKGVLWELWNEPNHSQFWKPSPNVVEYVALAKDAIRAIREVSRSEWIIGPAVSGFDWAFLESCFKAGLLKDFDAISIHPYRMVEPETVTPDWTRLRQLIKRYSPTKDLPLLSGEWGYSEKYTDLSETKQADFITRQMLTNLAAGVNLSVWYDWMDDGADPTEVEHHFGIVDENGKPKEAYLEVQRLVRNLGGARLLGRISSTGGQHCLRFQHGADNKVVSWSTNARRQSLTVDGITYGPRPEIGQGAATELELNRTHSTEIFDADSGVESGNGTPLRVIFQPSRRSDRISIAVDNPTGAKVSIFLRTGSTVTPVTFREGEIRKRTSVPKGKVLEVTNGRQTFFSRNIPSVGLVPLIGKTTLDEAGLAFVEDGNNQIPSMASAMIDRDGVITLNYKNESGWRFFRLAFIGALAKHATGNPIAILMRVLGQNQGVTLRARYTDSTGQTFQPEFGPIDWHGWRTVRIALDQSAVARWGGAKDGIVHWPIKVDCPLLIDPLGRSSDGQIKVKDVALEYQQS
jgi:hypothetical protein